MFNSHRSFLSAKHHVDERKELRHEFRREVLFLQSLGRLFFAENGIIDDVELNKVGEACMSFFSLTTPRLISSARAG